MIGAVTTVGGPQEPSMEMDAKPIHLNPARIRQASRDAARLGRLLEATARSKHYDREVMNEVALLQARITVAGYPPPMSPSSAAELSKHLGG